MGLFRHWLELPRVAEPEVMDDAGEVEAYASAAAQAHLDKIDDTFVEHTLRLLRSVQAAPGQRGDAPPGKGGKGLDIGCGPGQILLKLAKRLPAWHFTGVDRSPSMLGQAVKAREELSRQTGTGFAGRVQFSVADGCSLPFPDASFDLVLCNSVLHHLEQPTRLFAEIARVAAPGAAILLRDLRRPPRWRYPLHVRWHGRHYSGLMYKLYCDSVRAAYTPPELAALLGGSPLRDVRIFTAGSTHLGFERSAA